MCLAHRFGISSHRCGFPSPMMVPRSDFQPLRCASSKEVIVRPTRPSSMPRSTKESAHSNGEGVSSDKSLQHAFSSTSDAAIRSPVFRLWPERHMVRPYAYASKPSYKKLMVRKDRRKRGLVTLARLVRCIRVIVTRAEASPIVVVHRSIHQDCPFAYNS